MLAASWAPAAIAAASEDLAALDALESLVGSKLKRPAWEFHISKSNALRALYEASPLPELHRRLHGWR